MAATDELTAAERRQFNDAVSALRDALPRGGWLDPMPVRNPSGVLYEVRVFDREAGRIVAEVAIRPDGTLAPVRVR
jgi:hypothetical protein